MMTVMVMLSLTVPPPRYCPFPHWPPIILPIIALLLAFLMIPCYCYACGPMTGPYWAEQREKLIIYGEQRQAQMHQQQQQQYARPIVTGYNGGCNQGPRMRSAVNVNGYGRL